MELFDAEPPVIGSSLLQLNQRPVEHWLETTDERRRSAVLNYATHERSAVVSYLYASLLGMPASINEWETFVLKTYDKLDHRAILESEIVALHSDITNIRELCKEGKMKAGDAPTKLAFLSRELRGHVEQISKDGNLHDRRALLLAGVDLSMKYLKKTLGQDQRIWPVIEATLEAAFADVEEKNRS